MVLRHLREIGDPDSGFPVVAGNDTYNIENINNEL